MFWNEDLMFVVVEFFDEMMVIFVEDIVGFGKVNIIMYVCICFFFCFFVEVFVFLCLGVFLVICFVCRLKFWDKFEYYLLVLNVV